MYTKCLFVVIYCSRLMNCKVLLCRAAAELIRECVETLCTHFDILIVKLQIQSVNKKDKKTELVKRDTDKCISIHRLHLDSCIAVTKIILLIGYYHRSEQEPENIHI